MKTKNLVRLAALVALFSASIAQASVVAVYDTPTTTPGNQSWSGTLGNDFTVNSSGLTVTSLGAFNATHNGITTDITTGLYDITAGGWAINGVNFNGTPNSSGASYVFQSVAPVALIAGHVYSIEAWGFNSPDQNYNTNIFGPNNPSNVNVTFPVTFDSFGGALTNGNSRYDSAQNVLAATVFDHSSTFGAGTLLVSAVPEPQTYVILLTGLGLMGFMRRRKSAKKSA